jgi:SAM-dependent methyltransferase
MSLENISCEEDFLPQGFDPELYLIANPDVKRAAVDPIAHYQIFGKKEGRPIAPAGMAQKGWSYKGIIDSEFESNFLWAADVCDMWLKEGLYSNKESLRILDFGCGSGTTALGMALRYGYEVVGVDISSIMDRLEKNAKIQLGLKELPKNLTLRQINPGADLKEFGRFDAIISWSVFEHVDINLFSGIINNFFEVLKPCGAVFIQIDPLYSSPFGSHLKMFIDEPWSHLHYEREKIRSIAFLKPQPDNFHLPLSNPQSFDQYRHYLLNEFDKLNRIKAEDLVRMFKEVGFRIIKEERNKMQLEPPSLLLKDFSYEDLITNEIRVMFSC